MVPWDPPGVPRVPILGKNHRMFSKLKLPLEVTPIPFSAMADFRALRGASGGDVPLCHAEEFQSAFFVFWKRAQNALIMSRPDDP